MKATDVLRSEHEVILDVLAAVESLCRQTRGKALDRRAAGEALDFLRCFGDRCHHGKEEQHLFPALAARGLPSHVGPLAVMGSEHEQGRALLTKMSEALAEAEQSKDGAEARFATAGEAYVALMRSHIQKENGVLFPMGDGMLSEQDQADLLSGFQGFEHDHMGAGTHQRFLDIASRLVERLGVVRDRNLTAPSHTCGCHDAACP